MPLSPTHPWRVLVFPAATEIGLEICRALRDCKEVVLHGANMPGRNLAEFHFHRLHQLPLVGDPSCVAALQDLLTREKIDAIFPAHDDALLWLAEHAAELPATALTSPLATVRICRSKRQTYRYLTGCVELPTIYDGLPTAAQYPVFVKPDYGQGSLRARRLSSPTELTAALQAEPDLVIADYLPGKEYTVDCFSQRGRGVLFAKARERIQIRNGIATLTQTVDWPEARMWAERIAEALDFHGSWFFQVKADRHGQMRLLEVAPRIAGSMALHRALGINFPLLNLYEAAEAGPLTLDSHDGAMIMGRSLDTRFLDSRPVGALYIDLDDTLILRDQINPRLMALVFQCRNRAIPINLITKHRGDLNATLQRFRLNGLFDRVIHIADAKANKADHITEADAVLIDDSFRERQMATQQRGIRCFDAAGALCLLDERDL